MKNVITFIAAVICLSFTRPSQVPVDKSSQPEPLLKSRAVRPASFPTDVTWTIAYFPDQPMLALSWQTVSNPLLGPVPFTFQGVTQYANPHTTTSVFWAPVTLTANTSYTMNIAGVNYYFYWPGGGAGQCVITGHS